MFGLLGAIAVFAAFAWALALSVKATVDDEAAAHQLRRLSEREVQERVAREDMMGLPSRLEGAPKPDMIKPWLEGTREHPFPATEAGVARLFEVYAVTPRGCKGTLPAEERAADELLIYVTLVTVDGVGRVSEVTGAGEGTRTQTYDACLLGGFGPAVFEAPPDGEKTFAYRLRRR